MIRAAIARKIDELARLRRAKAQLEAEIARLQGQTASDNLIAERNRNLIRVINNDISGAYRLIDELLLFSAFSQGS